MIEFVGYSVAVGLSVEENDPTTFENDAQFKAMLAYFIRRSLELHRRFASLPDFQSDTSDNLESLRAFIARTYGDEIPRGGARLVTPRSLFRGA